MDEASKETRPNASGQTLLVLPDGEMINYLARMPNSVAPFEYYTPEVAGPHERILVEELRRHPPDWVAIVSRDLRGIGHPALWRGAGEGLRDCAMGFRKLSAGSVPRRRPFRFSPGGFHTLAAHQQAHGEYGD